MQKGVTLLHNTTPSRKRTHLAKDTAWEGSSFSFNRNHLMCLFYRCSNSGRMRIINHSQGQLEASCVIFGPLDLFITSQVGDAGKVSGYLAPRGDSQEAYKRRVAALFRHWRYLNRLELKTLFLAPAIRWEYRHVSAQVLGWLFSEFWPLPLHMKKIGVLEPAAPSWDPLKNPDFPFVCNENPLYTQLI